MSTVLVSGDRGFIGSYVTRRLLSDGHTVIGIDNNSKYGYTKKPWDINNAMSRNYYPFHFDIRNEQMLKPILKYYQPDYFIMGAAKIGGISYFHTYPYTLLAENEQIMAAQFNSAIEAFQNGYLEKVTVISSSMVYEGCNKYPHVEGDELLESPPHSSYGFQKLATEYFARAALDEFGLPYTIVRPFNCVGIGEVRALGDKEVMSGEIKLAMSHVVPDLIHKIYRGQTPLKILGDGTQTRQYTYGEDLANGIVDATLSTKTRNNDYNLSTGETTSVIELAQKIWDKMRPGDPFSVESTTPFEHDVQRREADSSKAHRDFGWKATKSLDEILDIVIPWVCNAIDEGKI